MFPSGFANNLFHEMHVGQQLLLTCQHCSEMLGFDFGSGMLLPEFLEVVAKKRAAVRREVASLEPHIVPGTFEAGLALFRCGKCIKYYNRPLLRFEYWSEGAKATYQATELCSTCKGVCDVVSLPLFDQLPMTISGAIDCPTCRHTSFLVSEALLWD